MNIYKKVIFVTVMTLIWSWTVSYGFNLSQSGPVPSKKSAVPSEIKSREEVWQVVLNMNFCRLEGDPKDLADYLHQNVTAIMPTTGERLEGREAFIAAWAEFSRTSAVEYHTSSDKKIDIYDNTAVVTYNHDMFYIIDSLGINASHCDMVVLIKENGKWCVVAYRSSPFPQKNFGER